LTGKKKFDFIKNSDLLSQELLDNWEKYQVSDYYVLDDTFNDNEYKLNLLLTAVKKLPFRPNFWSYTRLDLLTTRNHVDLLYEIGLRSMYFGIETLNPTTAKIIGKGFDRERQIDTVRYIRDRYPDIRMHGSFIIGLPQESIESVTDTFNRCFDQDIPLHTYRFHQLIIKRPQYKSWSSEIERDFEKFGYLDLSENKQSKFVNWKNKFMDAQIYL
jgi:radical SAM superfamily enzyme YgiQ (UPF0313 family)